MIRSMYSGISGMKGFQTKLDVIGNNIANVNTHGFKKGRVMFQDLMSQQMQSALAPGANQGGVNPQQVGTGSTVGAIDTVHGEGPAQYTGRSLDLMMNGAGFFSQSNQMEKHTTQGLETSILIQTITLSTVLERIYSIKLANELRYQRMQQK